METCLLQAKNLPPSLWDEAVNCASYIQNRFPHKSVVGATPFEALHGHKPMSLILDFLVPNLGLEYHLTRGRPPKPKVANAFCWDMQKMQKLTSGWRLQPEDASLKEVSISRNISYMILLQQHRKV